MLLDLGSFEEISVSMIILLSMLTFVEEEAFDGK